MHGPAQIHIYIYIYKIFSFPENAQMNENFPFNLLLFNL